MLRQAYFISKMSLQWPKIPISLESFLCYATALSKVYFCIISCVGAIKLSSTGRTATRLDVHADGLCN